VVRRRGGSPNLLKRLRLHWIAVTILIVRAALGLLYSSTIPIWEAFDEPGHYGYVRYIATRHALPRTGDPEAESISERLQPPLYYLLGALSIDAIGTRDDSEPNINPFFPAGTGGVNYALHPDSEGFPYTGTVLAVHLVRYLSIAISLVGILLTYLVGVTIAPSRREVAIGAMAIHAFWPQFLFNGSVVTNDVLASAIGSAIILLLARMIMGLGGALQVPILGFVFGLGLLSKLNTVSLMLVAAPVLVYRGISASRRADVRHRLSWVIAGLLTLLVVMLGWGILRRMEQVIIPVVDYEGGLLSQGVLAGLRQALAALDLATVRRTVSHTLNTFFALFGWGNIAADPAVYDLYAAVLAVAAIGLLLFFIRRRSEPPPASIVMLLGAFLAALSFPLLLVVTHDREVSLAPGRYLMPAISAFAVLLFVGCDEVSRFRGRSPLPSILIAILLLFAVIVPFRYIGPAYARPRVLSPAEVGRLEHKVFLSFGDRIELLAYELDSEQVEPGRWTQVTLYWRALKEMEHDYTVCVRLLGPTGESDGADCTYPGRGNYATSLWNAGDIFADTYHYRVPRDFPAPSFATINVAIFRYPEEQYLSVSDSQGAEVGQSATFGRVKVGSASDSLTPSARKLSYRLGEGIGLVGYELTGTIAPGDSLSVTLYWSPSIPINEDWTVFVHLVDQAGQLWSQDDSQPRDSTYPTSLWAEGEVIADVHELTLPADLPAGTYEIRVGMYRLETVERLPVVDPSGDRQPGDTAVLEKIPVSTGGLP
jgi:hypothetical protein